VFNARLLSPEERIAGFCRENRCGNYGANYSCPPFCGTTAEIAEKLEKYEIGVLLQYSREMDVRPGNRQVRESKLHFHRSLLRLERGLKKAGFSGLWGISAGSCSLCENCTAPAGEPCRYPSKRRSSLEALGIDVLALLAGLGLDNEFHPDSITWTGCILLGHNSSGRL